MNEKSSEKIDNSNNLNMDGVVGKSVLTFPGSEGARSLLSNEEKTH
jgi:hypothetical protein